MTAARLRDIEAAAKMRPRAVGIKRMLRWAAMKLRIRGDALRLRLSQRDLETLAQTGEVAEAIHFGPGGVALRYVLRASAGASALSASFDGAAITVAMPLSQVHQLAQTDAVGVAGEQALPGGRQLSLLVEKDFRCLVPRAGEDDTDGFVRPQGAGESC